MHLISIEEHEMGAVVAVVFLAPLRYGAALLVLACVGWWWAEASA